MSTQSSSKAAELPEWKRALLAVPRSKQNQSQQRLIRALYLYDELISKAFKEPMRVTYSQPPLQITAGLLELFSLNVTNLHLLDVYPKIKARMHEIAKIQLNEPLMIPAILFKMCFGIYGATISVLSALHYNLDPEPLDEREKADYLVSVTAASNLVPLYSGMRSQWAGLKASGADALLHDAGSKITVNEMKLWCECIIAAGSVCDLAMKDRDLDAQVVPMLGITLDWLNEFSKIKNPAAPLSLMTRTLVKAVGRFGARFLADSFAAMSPAQIKKYDDAFIPMLRAADQIFRAEMEAAKAAVPRDPVRIAIACCQYGEHLAFRYARAPSPNSGSRLALHQEAMDAYEECKSYLPPIYARFLKIEINAVKDGYVVDRMRAEGNAGADVPQRFISTDCLASCCAGCGAVGHEHYLKLCSQCKKVYYCSIKCQKKDWKNHKKVCKSGAGSSEAAIGAGK